MRQIDIEERFSRRNIRERVAQDIDLDCDEFKHCVKSIDLLRDHVYYPAKTKRYEALHMSSTDIAIELFIAVLPIEEMNPIQSIAGQLGTRLGYKHVLDGVKTASEIIAVCEPSGLYTLFRAKDSEFDTLSIRPNYCLSDDVLSFIRDTMYLPPMITEPVPWTSNNAGGYLQGSGSVILKTMNQHNKPQNLEAINTIQGIEWELDEHLLELEETPNKHLDTDTKKEQFESMKTHSRTVYEALEHLGNKFYFTWKYCSRGRMYMQGYHVSLQSTKYKRALLSFAKKELIQ